MTAALAAALAGLALVDSLNPSAIAVTLVLMTAPRPAVRAAAYLGAVFTTYLLAGVLILLGLDAVWSLLDSRVGYVLQVLVGGSALAYAIFARPSKSPPLGFADRPGSMASLAVLGAVVTLVEFSTAIPYLGALTLLAGASISWPGRLATLLLYNAVFIAPPLFIVVARLALGARVAGLAERWGKKLQAGGASTMLWLLGIAGFLLLRNGLMLLGVDLGLIDVGALGSR